MQQLNDRVHTETTVRGCNPSFVITSAGTVVIDTPQLPTRAVAMRKEVEPHGPIRYLINIEHHVDRIFANHWFPGAGTVVNHKACTTTSWSSTRSSIPRNAWSVADAVAAGWTKEETQAGVTFPDLVRSTSARSTCSSTSRR
jgi:hypothetical protein